MNGFRNTDLKEVAGVKVVSKMDLKKGEIKYADGTVAKAELPSTNVIKYDLGNDEWLCIRPSGTEPKLKVYVSTNAATLVESQKKNAAILEDIARGIE